MTSQEMIDAFLLQYDLNGSGAVAGFTNEEILEFLNKAQLDIVKKGFIASGPELFQTLIDNFKMYMTEASSYLEFANAWVSTASDAPEYFKWPTNYLFYISSRSKIVRSNFPLTQGTGEWVVNKLIQKKDSDALIMSENDAVKFYIPKVFVYLDTLTIIVDSFSQFFGIAPVTNAMMSYLRKPVDMKLETTPGADDEVDSELDIKWHQEIVDSALVAAMLVVNDVRIRTKAQPQK